MTDTLLALVAFSPILVAAVLLVGLNWPAKRAMPIAFLLTVFIGLNLLQSAFTGFCPAAMVFKKLGLSSGCAFR